MEYEVEYTCLLCHKEFEVVQASEPKENEHIGFVCENCYQEELYEDSKKFGAFIFKLRSTYGWSRDYVARKLGFSSESSVMNFETGHTIMKPKHINRFCKITPNKLTVPVLFAMFEAGTIKAPCKCVCHHDMNSAVPNIYDIEGRCRLCDHIDGDCTIFNGLWFENSKGSYFNHEGADK